MMMIMYICSLFYGKIVHTSRLILIIHTYFNSIEKRIIFIIKFIFSKNKNLFKRIKVKKLFMKTCVLSCSHPLKKYMVLAL